MSLRKQLLKSFLGVGAMYALSLPLGLLTSIILARTLGPDDFGQYVFVMALWAVLALPVTGGVSALLTREVAGYSHAGQWSLYRGVVRAANSWVLGLSLLILAGYVLVGPVVGWIPDKGKWALLGIVVFLIPLQGLNAVRNGTIKGLGFPALAEMPTQLLQPLGLLVVVTVLVYLGGLTVQAALWGQVFAGAVALVVASVLYCRTRPRSLSHCQTEYQVSFWFSAMLPLTLISVIGMFNTQLGIVLLGVLGTDEAVAAFRVGERGAQLVMLALALVNMVIAPHIVRAYREGDGARLQNLSRKSARGAFLIALPTGLLLIAFGKPLITLTFGAEYTASAYLPLVILVFGQLFNVAMGSVGDLLIMSGHEKLTLVGQAVGLGVAIISALLLIPVWQQTGAAVAVALGLVVWNSSMGYAVVKRLNIRPGIL